MKDNFKILKVESLSNQCSDLPQILNLNVGRQIRIEHKMKTTSNGSNGLDLTRILNLSFSEYQKWNISATTYLILLKS
jgi:hypothetical protein